VATTITVPSRRGETLPLKVYSKRGGLAATRPADGRGGSYGVTHLASGRLLFEMPSLSDARRAIACFLALPVDWTADPETIQRATDDPTIRGRLFEIRQRAMFATWRDTDPTF